MTDFNSNYLQVNCNIYHLKQNKTYYEGVSLNEVDSILLYI